MAADSERRKAMDAIAALGWTVADKPNGNGYIKVSCPCGRHSSWLHKTPSNPSYYRQFVSQMRRKCTGHVKK